LKLTAFAALSVAALLVAVVQTGAQTLPAQPGLPGFPAVTDKNPFPALPIVGPVAVTPEVREQLTILHDRKATLKDFTAKIDYSVDDRGNVTGKRGTVDYLVDPTLGPKFSADFTMNTVGGKPRLKNHAQFIFDGKDLTAKDWGPDDKSKTFVRTTLLKPGDKPGDTVTLRGALTLPIGLDVDDVIKTFAVTQQPASDPDQAVLRLIPRPGTNFAYKQLDITIGRKDQLPVKLEQTALDESVTTISLTDIHINPGTAKMLDSSTPAADGWTPKGGAPSGAGAPVTGPTPATGG